MSKFLRGNYKIKKCIRQTGKNVKQDFSKIFESRALEKLGGSIAFVSKATMLWNGDEKIK